MYNFTQKIIDEIIHISGRYPPTIVFSDWVHMAALATQNAVDLNRSKTWKQREKEYMDIYKKYEKKDITEFSKMLIWLSCALEENMSDVLGNIYMKIGSGSKQTGQFFTPYHVSKLCSELMYDADTTKLNEPSCGSGGMVIAMAQALKEKNINYQRKMDVVAQDLDWRSVCMAYVQFSILGIKAIVIQGDAMATQKIEHMDRGHVFYTPAKMGMII